MLIDALGNKDYVIAAGGFNGKHYGHIQLYDIELDKWRFEFELDKPSRGSAVIVVDADVYVLGGYTERDGILSSTVYFNLITGGWRMAPRLTCPRCLLACVARGRSIIAVGGRGDGRLLENTDILDMFRLRWTAGPALRKARCSLGLAMSDDRLYAVGGDVGGSTLGSVMVDMDPVNYLNILDFSTNEWHPGPRMKMRRCDLAVVAAGHKIFAIGGYGTRWEGNRYLDCMEMYDIDGEFWEAGPSMPFARSGLGAVVCDKAIMVMGGPFAGVGVTTLQVLDLQSMQWSEGAPLGGKFWGLSSALALGLRRENEVLLNDDVKAEAYRDVVDRKERALGATCFFERARNELSVAITAAMAAGWNIESPEIQEALAAEQEHIENHHLVPVKES